MDSKLGQHFELGAGIPLIKIGDDDFSGYRIEQKIAVEFLRKTERFLLQSIIQRAQEDGVTDLYVINEDFVMDAIKEKLEREEQNENQT